VFASNFSVWTICLSTVWTVDSFWRKSEGKSEGFVFVVMDFEGWSVRQRVSANQMAIIQSSNVLTSALHPTAAANEYVARVSLRRREQIAAVCAEYYGSDGRHLAELVGNFRSKALAKFEGN